MTIKLTDEETATFVPIFAALDARARGYAEGVEAAKREIIQALAANRMAEPGKPELVKGEAI